MALMAPTVIHLLLVVIDGVMLGVIFGFLRSLAAIPDTAHL